MDNNSGRHILVLDTKAGDLAGVAEAFESVCDDCDRVERVTSSEELLSRVSGADGVDLVVLDYRLGDGRRDGLSLLGAVRSLDGEVPVVAVSESGDVDTVKDAISAGATDFLVRTNQLSERVSTQMLKIRNLFSLIDMNRRLGRHLEAAHADGYRYRIVGRSECIKGLIDRIGRVAGIPRPVLVTGERGTGKELVARAIHEAAGPGLRPFVVVNCAAFTDTLLESELFGHEKGSFTGARTTTRGKFEQADGGVLFLDEIGNMSINFQQKILRVVEYGTFTRVGGEKEIKVKARIIAATNCDLERMIREGRFLPDLYDRLSFEVLQVPPLRERKSDVAILAQYFLEQFMHEVPAFQGKRLSVAAVEMLESMSFPGNVRELKNIIERAVYRDTTNELTPEDFDVRRGGDDPVTLGSFKDQVERLELGLLKEALKESGGNQAEAARLLGLSYHQFRHYRKKYSDDL